MTTPVNRRLLTTAIALLSTGALVISTSAGASAAPEPIVIAMEGPLSGSQASNGKDMYRGVKLAVSQVNAQGGVLGRQVTLVRADDQANPDLALSVAKGAKKAGAVAVIGPYNSSVGVINLPYYVSN